MTSSSDGGKNLATQYRTNWVGIPLWALGLASGLFIVTCIAIWSVVLVTRPTSGQVPTPTAVFIVLPPDEAVANPTATLILVDSPTPELTPTIPPPQVEGIVQIGGLVQVVNTGGDGLRLRLEPGLDGEVNYLALEFEVLQVQNGPREVDGFIWWSLVAEADPTRNGWGAENWLQVVRGP